MGTKKVKEIEFYLMNKLKKQYDELEYLKIQQIQQEEELMSEQIHLKKLFQDKQRLEQTANNMDIGEGSINKIKT